MPSFEELGLREELLRALEDEDIERPTALQEAVIPTVRRGKNLVARASTGSGKTLAYALGILDRLQPLELEEEAETVPLRLLVLTPTQEEAERVALSVFAFAQATGSSVTVPGGNWGTPPSQAEILVAPVADVMDAVRSSSLKLDGVEAVVVDGASAIHAMGGWDQVDALLDLLPRDAQRVVVSPALPSEVQDLVDRRVKRAIGYPSESVLPEDRAGPSEGQIGYVLVAPYEKLEVLARQLAQPREGGAPPVIYCRTDERAAELAEHLAIRGFVVGAVDDEEADVAVVAADAVREDLLEESGDSLGQTISFDVPADAATLRSRHGGDDDAVVIVEPRELAHLREVAALARLRARSIPIPAGNGVAAAALNAFRDEVRRAVADQDLGAQMLVLEPLFSEFSAGEVAAALAALLRSRAPAAAPAAGAAGAPAQPATTAGAGAQQRPAPAPRRDGDSGPAPATWARLYVGVGNRDDVRPGDIVGALAGEANIPGARIGKIDIRDTFSIVEVQADVADQVIRSVNGTTIKGRSVRVDYDRGGERGRKGGAPPRRQSNRPGGGGGGGGGGDRDRGGPGGGRKVVRRPPRDE